MAQRPATTRHHPAPEGLPEGKFGRESPYGRIPPLQWIPLGGWAGFLLAFPKLNAPRTLKCANPIAWKHGSSKHRWRLKIRVPSGRRDGIARSGSIHRFQKGGVPAASQRTSGSDPAIG